MIFFAAIDAELDHGVLAVLALQNFEQPFGRDGQGDGGELFAVGDRRDLPLAAQATEPALAAWVRTLASSLMMSMTVSAKPSDTKSELTESLWWMRRIASPSSRAIDTSLILPDAAASGESGMLLVTTTSASGDSMMRWPLPARRARRASRRRRRAWRRAP